MDDRPENPGSMSNMQLRGAIALFFGWSYIKPVPNQDNAEAMCGIRFGKNTSIPDWANDDEAIEDLYDYILDSMDTRTLAEVALMALRHQEDKAINDARTSALGPEG